VTGQNLFLIEYDGGCHCGRVRFAVFAPREIEAIDATARFAAKVDFFI